MSPDHDEPEEEYEEDEAPRSIFSATWFRVLLVVLALGVVGAIAIPYVLDVVNEPPTTTARVTPAPAPESAGARAVTAPAETAKPLAPTPPPQTTAPTAAMPKDVPASSSSAKSVPSTQPAAAAKPAEPAKAAEPAKPADSPKASRAVKEPVARGERVAAAPSGTGEAKDGDYFVQVGAFKDEGMAKQVAGRLRELNYPVVESVTRGRGTSREAPRTTPPAPAAMPGDRYDVLVSGGAAADINTKLAAKGLASEPSGDGVRIRPSLPLRDAVALSKDLGSEGFKVQVRRGGSGGGGGSEPSAPAVADTPALYRVRVGGYSDRAAAQVVLRELRDKGYDPFIAKGRD